MNGPDKVVEEVLESDVSSRPAGAVALAEMSHSEVRDQLSDYADGSLPEDIRSMVAHHLAGCAPCRAFRDSLTQTVDLLHRLPHRSAPASAKARAIQTAFASERKA